MTIAFSNGWDIATPYKIPCNGTASLFAIQVPKIPPMQLGEIVKSLREAEGWGTPELAKRVVRAGGAKVSYQNIQQLENKPDTKPGYLIPLAKAFGKTVEELYLWRPGMRTIGPNVSPKAVREPATVYGSETSQTDSKHRQEIDQLRVILLNVMDVLISNTPGAASSLLTRLQFLGGAFPDPDHSDGGFHARVVSTLQNVARSDEARRRAAPEPAAPIPSRRKPTI